MSEQLRAEQASTALLPPSPHVREQQRDHLCGPFCAARLMREAGFAVEEEELAQTACTVLPDRDAPGVVPPGASSFKDYPAGLQTGPPEQSGTAAGPLAEAIEASSDGALRCLGMHGQWSGSTVVRLVDESRSLRAGLLANLRTGLLWGSRPPVSTLLSQLETGSAPHVAPDWDVGHFVQLRSLIRGPDGALVVVRDTYPTLGVGGFHLQPPAVLASALRRDDGQEGGVLAVVPAEKAAAVAELAESLGLENGMWDNGTRR